MKTINKHLGILKVILGLFSITLTIISIVLCNIAQDKKVRMNNLELVQERYVDCINSIEKCDSFLLKMHEEIFADETKANYIEDELVALYISEYKATLDNLRDDMISKEFRFLFLRKINQVINSTLQNENTL